MASEALRGKQSESAWRLVSGVFKSKGKEGTWSRFLPFFFSEGFAIDLEGVGRWSFWLDWHYPVNYLKKTFKACENIVKEASYFYFEIQFYGEC